MTLREHLARQFAGMLIARIDDREQYDAIASFNKIKFLSLADECIRQMEWARRRCGAREQDFGHNDYSTVIPPLTAAEDGWKVRDRLQIPCSKCGTYSRTERDRDGAVWFFCSECGNPLFPAATPTETADMFRHPLDHIDAELPQAPRIPSCSLDSRRNTPEES